MGRITRYEVVFSKEDAIFQAGDEVEGFVYLDLNEEFKCRAVRIRCSGECHTYVDDGSSSEDEWENYYEETITVFGKMKGQPGEDPVLQPGSYEYPFKFQLPMRGLPSSFEYKKQYVRYMVKSFIDIPRKFDRSAKKFFTLIQVSDLNQERNAMKSQRKQAQKSVGMWCCAAGYLDLWMQIPRTGYVPGESIILKGEANNHTTREMSATTVYLAQNIKVRAHGKKKRYGRNVVEIKKLKYAPGETCVWDNQPLLIPAVAPSFLMGCSLIDLYYSLEVSASPSGPSFDLDLSYDIIIGTVPHREALAMESAYMPPPAGPNMVKIGFEGQAQGGPPPSEGPIPLLPPPSYNACMFGEVEPEDKRDKGANAEGNQKDKFAPRYTYYNFQPNPAT
ncbi:arrestin domain-containing protein 3-like [Lineus longissimus]|uniref:arrestin domain-containing protein 3-like n=1 Tax=Lineus longissimus TaxID=88925 RepID=UPI002B4C81F6